MIDPSTGASSNGSGNSGVFSSPRRTRSRLAAWDGGGNGGVLSSGERRRQAAGTRGKGGGFSREEGTKRARRGARSQKPTAEIRAGGGGGGARAALTMEAAYAAAGLEGADGEPGATASPDLSKMKLPELKELYRAAGGKPGALRKAELVERLKQSRQIGAVTAAAAPAPEPRRFEAEATPPAGTTPQAGARAHKQAEHSSPSLFNVLAGSGGRMAIDDATDADADTNLAVDHAGPTEVDTHAAVPGTPVLAGAAAAAAVWSGEAAGGVAGDVLSSGPSAVVAAARARGAAAAAASSRVAAGGRLRAMAEARRHTEAVRSRASANTAVSQSVDEGVQMQGQQQQQQPRQRQEQQHRVNGAGAASGTPAAGEGTVGSAGEGRTDTKAVKGPGAAAVAAVAAAAAAARAAAAVAATPGYATRDRSRGRGNGGGRQEGRHQAAATPANRGNEAGGSRGVRGGDGGAWSVLADPAVPRRASHSPRQRRLPAMPNPWARGGVGGPAEGMPEEGDVVDAFLADTMVQTSEDREASGDPLFDRYVGVCEDADRNKRMFLEGRALRFVVYCI